MRLKLLLLLLVISGALYAQEPYRNLIFTEMRGDDTRFNYIEITNMGTKTVDLAEFEVGNYDPGRLRGMTTVLPNPEGCVFPIRCWPRGSLI